MLILGMLIYSSTFLAECGPAVDPITTEAVIRVESGGNPLAIGDNTLKKSFFPKTADEAAALASRLIAQGHSIDMGLMQVNSCHLQTMRLSVADLFDPCRNIATGTAILADCYRRYKSGDPVQSLFRALSAYNTGRSWRGTGYINKILQVVGASYRVSPPVEAQSKPGKADVADRGGSARIRRGEAKTRQGKTSPKEMAASSPLFFENLSSAMKAGEL